MSSSRTLVGPINRKASPSTASSRKDENKIITIYVCHTTKSGCWRYRSSNGTRVGFLLNLGCVGYKYFQSQNPLRGKPFLKGQYMVSGVDETFSRTLYRQPRRVIPKRAFNMQIDGML